MRLLSLFTHIYCFYTYIYLSAAGVTGAMVLHGPTAPVTSAALVACSSAMPAPGVSTLASAISATTSPR